MGTFHAEWTDGRTVRIYNRLTKENNLFVLTGLRLTCETGTYTPEALAAAEQFLERHGFRFHKDDTNA